MTWVYFLGSADGTHIKIGYSRDRDLSVRVSSTMQGQVSAVEYRLLAGVHGTRTNEQSFHKYFKEWRLPKTETNRTDLYAPAMELVEYVNWLRQRWWTTLALDDQIDERAEWDRWMPTPDRRVPYPPEDPERMFALERDWHGDLAGTPWDRLSTPEPIGEDFYTPPHIVEAARMAMGGIDLDPASHWRANREHRIDEYYTLHRSAFENPWYGRVWLNPPYGDWGPWLDRALLFMDSGGIEQMCMLGGVWAFTTRQARRFVDRSAAIVILTPTPDFWGQPEGRTGTKHPHMIVYHGTNPGQFYDAFHQYGIPIALVSRSSHARPLDDVGGRA